MLMMCGVNDVLMPYFQPVCDAYPDAESHVLEHGGVYAPDNCAEELANCIKGFLGRLTINE
jgi:hypothetical protein